ncbi:peptidoglycan DD-metalloendopeptidase family protein [Dethiosulfatarculus sandiegensis]|uniref:Peptidase M23 n=1 Tax=Dethiosulfatarculus sandiegensis TaxID=1429043 RepID=A0A0D2JVF2_9BACT|nr:peptidoglycan DD-metalloendopeptidase family protein [Dethiosulfatarculus sandiegensis]KIX13535.1 hypothetical protein X474_13700 [Dethiosulfatarculus sandiegensis]
MAVDSLNTSLVRLETKALGGAEKTGKTGAQGGDSKEEVREAARMMEALFLGMLWKEMRKTIPKGGLFDGGKGEEMFTDMLDRSVAEASVKGGSMGLAEMLERQLTKNAAVRPDAGNSYFKGLSSQGYTMPVDGVVSSPFGPRVHPITGEHKDHNGLDLAAELGADVKAAQDGKVVFAGEKGGYGNLIVLEHPGGQSTYYGHLDTIEVKVGDKIKTGQKMGTVGQTGMATGPHLHFEVRANNGNPVDPMTVLAMGPKRVT